MAQKKSKSDISNSAIRIFLQKVGEYYDESRGFPHFKIDSAIWRMILDKFSHSCCYCGKKLKENNKTVDHLIPMNKKSLGLHAWGNVVPCCQGCNKEKQSTEWRIFLKNKSKTRYNYRKGTIEKYQKQYKYNPNLKLELIADNLYEDVGAISLKLIELRLKQAQKEIEKILKN